MRIRYILSAVLLVAVLVGSCKKSKKKDEDPGADFDRKGMLENVGTNLLIPRYGDLQTKCTDLQTAANTFTASPDENNLLALRVKFQDAYLAWEAVEIAEFGPASDSILKNSVNNFPADTVKIKNNVSSGSYSLQAATNSKAKGFPALEYLLYGIGADNTAIVYMYNGDANAGKRKTYLTDIIANILPKITGIKNAWNTSYLSAFSNSTTTDQGSSLSLLVNSMSMGLETVRRERIGTPLGYVGLINSGTIYPKYQEAYYSNYSKELALAYLQKSKELFNGGTGSGLDDYLNFVGAKYDNGNLLSDEINAQFDRAIAAVQNFTPNYTTILNTDKPKAETAFLEVKKLNVLIKLDMASQLGIVINYTDNDGD